MDNTSIRSGSQAVQRGFIHRVYLWMALALSISAVSAFVTAASPVLLGLLFGSKLRAYALLGVQFFLIIFLNMRIATMRVSTAWLCFIAYSLVTGMTLSTVLLVYTGASVARVFFVSAFMFVAMAVYGMNTDSNLNSVGAYAGMALVGVIIASVINIFLRSSGLDWVLSIITVFIFTGLTAYDTQNLMKISAHADGSEACKKVAIIGALQLYLDFLNIFLSLLRLFGKRKD